MAMSGISRARSRNRQRPFSSPLPVPSPRIASSFPRRHQRGFPRPSPTKPTVSFAGPSPCPETCQLCGYRSRQWSDKRTGQLFQKINKKNRTTPHSRSCPVSYPEKSTDSRALYLTSWTTEKSAITLSR